MGGSGHPPHPPSRGRGRVVTWGRGGVGLRGGDGFGGAHGHSTTNNIAPQLGSCREEPFIKLVLDGNYWQD